MRGNSGLFERAAVSYLPYLGHYPNPNIVLLEDGSLLAMGRSAACHTNSPVPLSATPPANS